MPFKRMELIGLFLKGCRDRLKIQSRELFCTPDLFEEKNIGLVLQGLEAVARKAATEFADRGLPVL